MDAEREPVVRLACPDEAATIRDLVRAAYAIYVPRMGREPGPMLDDYAGRIAEGAAFVADDSGAPAGVLVLLDRDDHLLLDNVAVAPEHQGRGVGRLLIAFAEAEARRRGYREIRLYTHETMVENLAVYGRLGYEETHRVTEMGYRRIYMRKALG